MYGKICTEFYDEDVFSEPFQTDSRLSQLHLAGIFDHVEGVISVLFQIVLQITIQSGMVQYKTSYLNGHKK